VGTRKREIFVKNNPVIFDLGCSGGASHTYLRGAPRYQKLHMF